MLTGPAAFTRLLSVTVLESKYQLGQNHHFLLGQNRPVKTVIFVKKAYLNLIVLTKMAIFRVFDENDHFLVVFRTPLVFTVFHCFRGPRFPNGILGKVTFFTKIHEKRHFYQNHQKCHRQTWHFRNDIFDKKNMKFWHFWRFPWGLDRGFGQFRQFSGPWCQNRSRGVKTGQNETFPWGLDRGFGQNGQKVVFLLFFMVFPGFDEKWTFHGVWLGVWKLNFREKHEKVHFLDTFWTLFRHFWNFMKKWSFGHFRRVHEVW